MVATEGSRGAIDAGVIWVPASIVAQILKHQFSLFKQLEVC